MEKKGLEEKAILWPNSVNKEEITIRHEEPKSENKSNHGGCDRCLIIWGTCAHTRIGVLCGLLRWLTVRPTATSSVIFMVAG